MEDNESSKKYFIGQYKENRSNNLTTLKDCLLFSLFYNYNNNYYICKFFSNQKNEKINKLAFHIRMLFLNSSKLNNKSLINLLNNLDLTFDFFIKIQLEKKFAGKYELKTKYCIENNNKTTNCKIEKNTFNINNPLFEIPNDVIKKKTNQRLFKLLSYKKCNKIQDSDYKFKIQKIKITKYPKLLFVKLNRYKDKNFSTNIIFPSFFLGKKLTIFAIICLEDIITKNHFITFVRQGQDWFLFDNKKKNPFKIGNFNDLLTKFESKNYVLEQSIYLLYSEYKEQDVKLNIQKDNYYMKII